MFKEFKRIFNQNPLQTNIWETDDALIEEYKIRLAQNNERLEKVFSEEMQNVLQETYEIGRLLYNHIESDDSKKTHTKYAFKKSKDHMLSAIAEQLFKSLIEKRLNNLNEVFAVIKTISVMHNELNMRFFDPQQFEDHYKIDILLDEKKLTVNVGKSNVAQISVT